jgi:capsular polysaccharide biosynthesis protein
MRHKQELVAKHGIALGFAEYCATFGLTNVSLKQVQLESERDYAMKGAAFYRELAPAGEHFFHDPPAVVGIGNHQRVEAVSRAQYVACLADARVHGRSALLRVAGAALLDVQGREWNLLDDELDWDPDIFHVEGRQAWVIARGDRDVLRVPEAFSLLGAHTDFFGHWMSEYLPRYVAGITSGSMPVAPLLIDAHMPASHRQALEMFCPQGTKIIEVSAFAAVQVDKLWCTPTFMYMPLHEKRNEKFDWSVVAAPAERFEPAVRYMREKASARIQGHGPERVFLARKNFRHRRLVNAAEIENIARSRGFDVVYPEDFEFAEQVRLLANSKLVVGLEGSALFLVFFAPTGARLCILSHPFTDVLAEYNGIFSTQGMSTLALTGPVTKAHPQTPHDSDYRIDPADFGRTLDSMEGA